MTKKGHKEMTRRDFLKRAGQTAAVAGVSSLVPGFTGLARATTWRLEGGKV